MILNLMKAALLSHMLPKTGSVSGQLTVKDLNKKLKDFFEEMKVKTNFKVLENGKIEADLSKDEERDFVFSEAEIHELKRGVKLLDESESVTVDMLELCKEIELLK